MPALLEFIFLLNMWLLISRARESYSVFLFDFHLTCLSPNWQTGACWAWRLMHSAGLIPQQNRVMSKVPHTFSSLIASRTNPTRYAHWCLSEGFTKSSSSSSSEPQFSTGWSRVNLFAGRTRFCDCFGLFQDPGHAYSVAGPLATNRERVLRVQIQDFSPSSCLASTISPLTTSRVFRSLSARFAHREESRGDWLVRRQLRGSPEYGHRAQGVCKAGLIPLKCCFKKSPKPPSCCNPPLRLCTREGGGKESVVGSHDTLNFKGEMLRTPHCTTLSTCQMHKVGSVLLEISLFRCVLPLLT